MCIYYRSNPGTPTSNRRDFIVSQNQQPGLTYYDFPMHQQPQQNNQQILVHQQVLPPYHPNGSPQRRFLSEGELLGRNNGNGMMAGTELSYVGRTNNTVDNIRELAGSPQRGVYNWKDTSPPGYINQMPGAANVMYNNGGGQQQQQQQQQHQQPIISNINNNNLIGRPPLQPSQQTHQVQQQQQQQQQYHPEHNMYHRSNPTSPTQQQQQQQQLQLQQFNQNMANSVTQQSNVRQSNVSNIINNIVANSANSSGYHPALRGGIQVFPPQIPASPQVKRKQTPTRPMSFVRALEMADSIEMTPTGVNNQQSDQQNDVIKSSNGNPNAQQQQQNVDRGSVYDMNYEISV